MIVIVSLSWSAALAYEILDKLETYAEKPNFPSTLNSWSKSDGQEKWTVVVVGLRDSPGSELGRKWSEETKKNIFQEYWNVVSSLRFLSLFSKPGPVPCRTGRPGSHRKKRIRDQPVSLLCSWLCRHGESSQLKQTLLYQTVGTAST